MAVIVQLMVFGYWAGSQMQYQKELGTRLTELAKQVEFNRSEIIRIDREGSTPMKAVAATEHRSQDKVDARILNIETQVIAVNIKLERLLAVYERKGAGEK